MFGTVRELLSGVPTTEGDKVVALRAADDLEPPPAFRPTWRRTREHVIEMDRLKAVKASIEKQLAECTALAQDEIAKADKELAQIKRQYDEDVGLIIQMMNGELRMGIETGDEG